MLAASCSADLSIKLWDTATYDCVKTLHGHDHNVSSVCFTPEGDRLLSASRDKTIKLWEVQTGYCLRTWRGHDDWVRQVLVSEEGTLLASCSNDQTVRLWQLDKPDAIMQLKEHTHVVECIAFSRAVRADKAEGSSKPHAAQPSALQLASGSRDKSIKLWDTATGLCVSTLLGHDNWVRALAFGAANQHLVSASDDRSVRVWDLRQGRCVRTIADAHAHFITCLDLSAKHGLLATAGVDNLIKLFPCK